MKKIILIVFAFLSANGLYAQKVEKKTLLKPKKQTTMVLRTSTDFFLPPGRSVNKDSIRKTHFIIQVDSVRYQKFKPGNYRLIAPSRALKFREGRSVLFHGKNNIKQ